MFYVSAYDESNSVVNVTDTIDGVTEGYLLDDIIQLNNSGVTVEGVNDDKIRILSKEQALRRYSGEYLGVSAFDNIIVFPRADNLYYDLGKVYKRGSFTSSVSPRAFQILTGSFTTLNFNYRVCGGATQQVIKECRQLCNKKNLLLFSSYNKNAFMEYSNEVYRAEYVDALSTIDLIGICRNPDTFAYVAMQRVYQSRNNGLYLKYWDMLSNSIKLILFEDLVQILKTQDGFIDIRDNSIKPENVWYNLTYQDNKIEYRGMDGTYSIDMDLIYKAYGRVVTQQSKIASLKMKLANKTSCVVLTTGELGDIVLGDDAEVKFPDTCTKIDFNIFHQVTKQIYKSIHGCSSIKHFDISSSIKEVIGIKKSNQWIYCPKVSLNNRNLKVLKTSMLCVTTSEIDSEHSDSVSLLLGYVTVGYLDEVRWGYIHDCWRKAYQALDFHQCLSKKAIYETLKILDRDIFKSGKIITQDVKFKPKPSMGVDAIDAFLSDFFFKDKGNTKAEDIYACVKKYLSIVPIVNDIGLKTVLQPLSLHSRLVQKSISDYFSTFAYIEAIIYRYKRAKRTGVMFEPILSEDEQFNLETEYDKLLYRIRGYQDSLLTSIGNVLFARVLTSKFKFKTAQN